MNTWFECTAKYIRMDETGHEKMVSETYLLDAISFTEAESRIYKELQTMVSGEFTVSKISKTRISEIIPADTGDRWYKARVAFITVDEQNGKEKRVSQFILVFSDSIRDAYGKIIEAMHGMMVDFVIIGINESTIIDVFPYINEKSEGLQNLKPSESIQLVPEFQADNDFPDNAIDEELNEDTYPV